MSARGRRPIALPGPGDTLAEHGEAFVREVSSLEPKAAIVLGSGLGDSLLPALEAETELSFAAIPGFPKATVPGHAGRLLLGRLRALPVAVFAGRVHYYEGHGMDAVTLIPRLAAALGATTLVLTNAAGGLDPTMTPGDLMAIRDHMNQMGVDPLFGWRLPDGSPAFVDTSGTYTPRLIELTLSVAREAGSELRTGIYAAASGPSYETPAERVALVRLGADAVGMSTVPEAVAGTALGMEVLGISCITNVVGGETEHGDVLGVAAGAAPRLGTILGGVLERLGS